VIGSIAAAPVQRADELASNIHRTALRKSVDPVFCRNPKEP
jgi:hypothetical protein